MIHRCLTLMLTAAMAQGAAMANENLIYTTADAIIPQQTLSNSGGTILQWLGREDVAVVEPIPGQNYSAETLIDQLNWATLAGDKDGDDVFVQNPLFGAIDALFFCPYEDPSVTRFNARRLFFSSRDVIGDAGCGTITPGDIATFSAGGGVMAFIKESQIRDAFGISDDDPVNVDAFAVAYRYGGGGGDGDDDGQGGGGPLQLGAIFLSLEDDVVIQGGLVMEDGAIGVIPANAIQYGPCRVDGVALGSGFIARNEAEVDAMVLNAQVADHVGAQVMDIADLDGLALDPRGGEFTAYREGQEYRFPNLLFCGESLTDGGVLTTRDGGRIAELNGQRLAASFGLGSSDGRHVGLAPNAPHNGLNALEVFTPHPCRFVLDSSTQTPVAGGLINITYGGAAPFQPVLIGMNFSDLPACGAAPSIPAAALGMPEMFMTAVGPMLPGSPDGFLSVTNIYPGGAPLGWSLVLQGITPKGGGLALSTPITLQF